MVVKEIESAQAPGTLPMPRTPKKKEVELLPPVPKPPALTKVEKVVPKPEVVKPSETPSAELKKVGVSTGIPELVKLSPGPSAKATEAFLSKEDLAKVVDQPNSAPKDCTVVSSKPGERRFLVMDKELCPQRWMDEVGWEESMDDCVGEIGTFVSSDERYGIELKVRGHDWWFAPECLKEISPLSEGYSLVEIPRQKDATPELTKIQTVKFEVPKLSFLMFGYNHLTEETTFIKVIQSQDALFEECRATINATVVSLTGNGMSLISGVLKNLKVHPALKEKGVTAALRLEGEIVSSKDAEEELAEELFSWVLVAAPVGMNLDLNIGQSLARFL